MKIQLTKNQSELFENLGTVINTDNKYLFLPYLLKQTETEDVYELIKLGGKLPKDLVDFIETQRNCTKKY